MVMILFEDVWRPVKSLVGAERCTNDTQYNTTYLIGCVELPEGSTWSAKYSNNGCCTEHHEVGCRKWVSKGD